MIIGKVLQRHAVDAEHQSELSLSRVMKPYRTAHMLPGHVTCTSDD